MRQTIRRIIGVVLISGAAPGALSAQIYSDYIGTGHTDGVRISASSTHDQTSPAATLDRSGIDSAFMRVQAARFLMQATLGADRNEIDRVAQMGLEDWIDEQMTIPPSSTRDALEDALQAQEDACLQSGAFDDLTCAEQTIDWGFTFNMGWWQTLMTGEDLLRQRVALALSEILVISGIGALELEYGRILADYYDMLLAHAFGHYEDLLLDVSLHPAMGAYLSHFNNPRTDVEANIRPDENYAREIMQLFSIGLYTLHPDGTRRLDEQGNPIPTYDNKDIKEMAKVFTGLGDGGMYGEFGTPPRPYAVDFFVPMRMYEEQHEPGPKELLDGFIIPSGQSGMEDIRMAVHHLVQHPNTGPFISRRLIQHLVKSNPSPEYIARISAVFADNGEGERGDLGAVIKAILLDAEARDCRWIDDPQNGKLREPLVRYTHVLRALQAGNGTGNYRSLPYWYWEHTRQLAMYAPSVFNFYLPDYQPNGPISQAGLVGPEFQLHNTATSIGFLNMAFDWAIEGYLMENEGIYEYFGQDIPEDNWVRFQDQELREISNNQVLIDELELLLCPGQLTEATRNIILTALDELEREGYYDPEWLQENRFRTALYLMLISPDVNTQH